MSRPFSSRVLRPLYRSALFVLLPRSFRDRYGDDMERFLMDEWADSTPGARGALLVRAARDLIVTSVMARLADEGVSDVTAPGWRMTTMWMGLRQDVRFAIRMLARRPGFTVVAVMTLALGIGATSGIFTVLDGVVLKPLAYPEPDRLVTFWTTFTNQGDETFPMSAAEYVDYRADSESFEEMGAYGFGGGTLVGVGDARRVRIARTSVSLFQTLGIKAALGRLPGRDDDVSGAEPVAVLDHGFWTEAFGSDPGAVGQIISLDGSSLRVIGVLAPEAKLLGGRASLWLPLRIDRASITDRSGHGLTVLGRLAPGRELEAVRSEMDLIHERWDVTYAGQHTPGAASGHLMHVEGAERVFLGDLRGMATMLLAAVGMVLLIACVNVAGLLMARGETRSAEMGVRAALGAGRGRLVRQLVTESLLLATLGGIAGLILGAVATTVLLNMDPGSIPRVERIGTDGRALAFTGAVSLLTGLLFGVLPALQSGSAGQANVARGGRQRRRTSNRSLATVIVGQVALATVVLVGAGLMIRSLRELNRVDPGFNAESRVAFDVAIPFGSYPDIESVNAFLENMLQELDALPGVSSVAAVKNLPLRDGARNEGILIQGLETDANMGQYSIAYQGVTPGYFATLEIPVLEGRPFQSGDRRGAPNVALVNRSAAEAYWPGESAVGRQVKALFGSPDDDWITIVGVAEDVLQDGLAASSAPELYLPHAQTPSRTFGWIRSTSVVLRSEGSTTELMPAVRALMTRLDPNMPVQGLDRMERIAAGTLAQERFLGTLLGIFGAIALLIAAVGIYGTVSFAVAKRTREFGVRLALGASASGLLSGVLSSGAKLAVGGVTLGLLAAAAATPLLRAFLFGVPIHDLVTFSLVPAVLVATALVASLAPAVRASSVSPVKSLREEG